MIYYYEGIYELSFYYYLTNNCNLNYTDSALTESVQKLRNLEGAQLSGPRVS